MAPSTKAISATGSAACSPLRLRKRSGGDIAAEIYPNSSLIKTNAQFSAMRKGALDISLYPMPYAGGELPETNIGLMPGLVATYEQGLRWKKEPVGKALTDFLADKGIILLTWVWQAGGVASRSKAIVAPEDAKGMKVRGGSREMDMVLQTAGASVLSVPSNEIYTAMQTGACDAGITSSTSLISFRLEEVSKALTSGAGASYWFMLEPLMMSKSVFDALPKNHQDIIVAVGAELEAFGKKGAQDDDIEVAKVYEKAGAKVGRARHRDRRQVARYRPRYRLEGLWREDRDGGQPAEARVRRGGMMHAPLPDREDVSKAAAGNTLVAALERGLAFCNNVIVVLAALALIAACGVLSYSVLGRALFHSRQLLAGRGGGVSSGRRDLHDGGLCAGHSAAISASRRSSDCCRRGQPHPALAGRCREPSVLRVLCLEILDAGL